MTTKVHPDVERYRKAELVQLSRYIIGKELDRDQLLWNLLALCKRYGVLGYVDLHAEWAKDGYVLPWERDDIGAAGDTASQGGTR